MLIISLVLATAAVQSVALAGTLTNSLGTVRVDEPAIVAAGYVGALADLPISVTAFTLDVETRTVTYVTSVRCVRISQGLWAFLVPPPTVAGGSTTTYALAAGISAPIVAGTVTTSVQRVIATPESVQTAGVLAFFTRASS